MKIPNTVSRCYEALGLIPVRDDSLLKRQRGPKAKLCKQLITDFFIMDSSNLAYESGDELDQFQLRAEAWVDSYASMLWAATDRTNLFPGAPTYPQDKAKYIISSFSSTSTAADIGQDHTMGIAIVSAQSQCQTQAGQYIRTLFQQICSDISIGGCEGN